MTKQLFIGVLLFGTGALTASAQPFAYVTKCCDTGDMGSLMQVETPSNRVVHSLLLETPGNLAVSPDGEHVYVIDTVGNGIHVVDATSNTFTTVGVGEGILYLAVKPDGSQVYVIGFNGLSFDIFVISTTTPYAVTGPIPIPVGAGGIAFSPDGARAFIPDNYQDIQVLQTSDNTFLTPINVPGAVSLTQIAAGPHGSQVYVTDDLGPHGFVVDTETGFGVDFFSYASLPTGIAVAPDATTFYVTDFAGTDGNGSLLRFDLGREAKIGVEIQPSSVALSYPDGRYAYVTDVDAGGAGVSVVDTLMNRVIATTDRLRGVQCVATQPSPYVPLLQWRPLLAAEIPQDIAVLEGKFELSPKSVGLGLPASDLTLQMATFEITIPANSFQKDQYGGYFFAGTVNGVAVKATITPVNEGYGFAFELENAPLKGLQNPVTIRMIVGNNIGGAAVNALLTQ